MAPEWRTRRGAGWPTWLAAALCAAVAAFVLPSAAHAAGGGEGGADSTLVVLALIGAVAAAYLLTHFVVERLQKAFLVMTGIEYMVLGFLLGPNVPLEIPAFSDLDDLLPIVALAVGWVGLLRGMELSIRRIKSSPTAAGAARVVFVQALVCFGLTGGLAWLAMSSGYLFPVGTPVTEGIAGPREVWMATGVMACAAAAGSVGPIELLQRRYRLEGDLSERIRRMAAMSDLLAILVFGLLFCVFHKEQSAALEQPSATEWAVVTVGLGALLGVLFTPFLGDRDSENGRFLAMIGIIVLASGAAYFLDLSPLLVNLCLGAVLVNTAKMGPQIHATLERTKRPMALVLLVFAGALWDPPELPLASAPAIAWLRDNAPWSWVPWAATWIVPAAIVLGFAALFIGVRFASKAIGTTLASWRAPLRGDYFRGLMAHGEVSVAMAVSLRLVYEGPAIDLAYTAVLVSVVVNDLVAPRVLRGLLVDTGDLRGERTEEPA